MSLFSTFKIFKIPQFMRRNLLFLSLFTTACTIFFTVGTFFAFAAKDAPIKIPKSQETLISIQCVPTELTQSFQVSRIQICAAAKKETFELISYHVFKSQGLGTPAQGEEIVLSPNPVPIAIPQYSDEIENEMISIQILQQKQNTKHHLVISNSFKEIFDIAIPLSSDFLQPTYHCSIVRSARNHNCSNPLSITSLPIERKTH